MADKQKQTEETVTGAGIEPDESRTPLEFAHDELLTLEQVAKQMTCSAAQVRDWIASGMLTPVADGSIQRIRRGELNRIGNPDDGAARAFERDHRDEKEDGA